MDQDRKAVSIIGTGLMGGSLGLAALSRGLVNEVTGYDVDLNIAEQAKDLGAVTRVAYSLEDSVSGADLVFIATPVGVIPRVLEQVAGALAAGAVVSDVGSTKATIVSEAERVLPKKVSFVGGHPLAGSENQGIASADAALYEGCVWFLTPTVSTADSAYRSVVRFLGGLGARVLSLDPVRHDELVALTSHLPQIVSSALMGFAEEITSSEGGVPLVTAGGFRDMTRIAASSASLWVDILRDNRAAVLSLISRFRDSLADAELMLQTQDWGALMAFLENAGAARRRLPSKPGLESDQLLELLVPIPDRPGALAHVTTTLGEAGVNVEDIDIVHSPEGGRGTIHITVNGRDVAETASRALGAAGYEIQVR